MPRKRTWFIKLRSTPMTWGCLGRLTRREYTYPDEWARFVIIQAETEDGRPLDLPLTPNEARRIARQLTMRADWIEDTNRKQGDGWACAEDKNAALSITEL